MIKNLLKFLVFVCALSFQGLYAQTVTGTVTDNNGMPLPGVNVIEKGTNNGAATDFDGNYSITVSDSNATLVFSSIGFANQEIAINGRTTINVSMVEDTSELDEVVVTALGIKRETRALGYSISELEGEELTTIRTPNAINSLQGKVAGVNVTSNATGAAGSSRVIIRGASSLNGNNQPLYIVDGIPIGNDNNGAAGMWGGNDGGDGVQSINPDEVESISVLKSGPAAALYGSRAANGVILITTKSAGERKGFGVEINSSTNFDEVNSSLQDFQTTYGQGTQGRKPVNQAEALDMAFSSWGAPLDGSSVVQWDGVSRPYSNTGSHQDQFYRTGSTLINTIALSDSNDNLNYRLSMTNMDNEDVVPNSEMNRKSFGLNASAILNEKLTATVNAKYVIEDVQNRPRLSDAPGNANYSVNLFSPNVDVRTMKPGIGEDGRELRISSGSFTQNPYWSAFHFRNEDTRNRIIASTSLNYQILDWLSILGRVGTDHYTRKRTSVTPWGTAYQPQGSISEQERRYTQIDADVILTAERDITDKISATAFVGANSNHIKVETLNLGGGQFIVPGLEDIGNTVSQSRSRGYSERKLGSLYGSLEVSYDNWAFINFTARNDWFSTLSYPGKTTPNDVFYPSFNASLVLSDALEMPGFVDFFKVRGGYSQLTQSFDSAYALAPTYQIYGNPINGQPLGRINGGTVPNPNLVPVDKNEFEIGFDARLFGNRVSLDIAYYQNQTEGDIVSIASSVFSSYGGARANLGEVENKGVEVLLNVTPFRTDDFTWRTSINFTHNEGKVLKTDEDGTTINLDEPRSRNLRVSHIPGEAYGALVGTSFVRGTNGQIVYAIDAEGVPRAVEGPRILLGEGVPPVQLGISNSFTYKDFSLNFSVDGKFGGQIYSGTNATAVGAGLHKMTLEGRDTGLTVSGIDAATDQPFTTTVAPDLVQTYWGEYNDVAEAFVEDSDFIKFRQISLGYTVPSKFLENIFISEANISLIGTNLFYLHRSIDNVDPESAYNVGNSQGLEWFGVPSVRSYGINVNVKF
jgi:TonB-linked SusC/RagA family outer membrane protein